MKIYLSKNLLMKLRKKKDTLERKKNGLCKDFVNSQLHILTSKQLKKYFYLTSKNEINYLGEFPCFSAAWDYASYDIDLTFVWIFNSEVLLGISDNIKQKLADLNTDLN
jgi:hypothetical protein